MVAVKQMSKVVAGSVRKRPEANHSEHIKLYAQAKEPKQKAHKRSALENGSKKKDPASEPGNQHGKSRMRMPSVFRVTPREFFAESKKKGGWGGSNPYK